MTDAQLYGGIAAMGAVAGMRSMSAPAMLGQIAKAGLMPERSSRFDFLNDPKVSYPLMALAIGEVVFDKLPVMPKRTKVPSLVGRAITGGLTGASISSSKKRSALLGAAIGAAVAVGVSYGAYHLRRKASEKVPDRVVGLLEDAIAAGTGMIVLSKLRSAGEISA
jgi:uncharacterized membrane protein